MRMSYKVYRCKRVKVAYNVNTINKEVNKWLFMTR